MVRHLLERRPVRVAAVVTVGLGLLWVVAGVVIAIDGVTDSAGESDVVVVLGNEVAADGTPSARLAARLDAAVTVHTAGLADHVIVSGGVGRSGYDEAEVMAAYLIDAGIDPDRIVVDSDGVTTRATAVNAAAIMEERGWSSAIVATQFFHVPRTRLAFEQAGIGTVTTVHADHTELRDLYGLAREVPAYLRYLLTG